ncbi:unnamed protein product, partial [Didymodactylos carnosus]
RKILSYAQNRKGPNKVGFLGLIQPLLDGVETNRSPFDFAEGEKIEVQIGYLIRFIHSTGASLLFILIYIHIGRRL